MSKSTPAASTKFWKGFWPSMAVLVVILGFLFRESFKPGIVHFSNDGPLGVMMSAALAVPSALTGFWMDLSWIGMNGGAAPSSITYLLVWLLGPVGFAKFYPPIALLLLGAGAWIFFRTLKLSPGLCLVAAIAAALNMNFFSNTCWGLGTRALTLMSALLALAALMNRRRGNRWLNAALAGFCIGLGVIEGADNGAIFSLFIAAFVVFQAFAEEPTLARKIASCVRLGVVGLCAAFIAAQVLVTLTGIAAKTSRGAKAETAAVSSMSAEEKNAEEQRRWNFATQWSLPPIEMLRVIIPGLYGYRMDTPNGGEYWGRVGQDVSIPDGPDRRASRSSGAGEYAGVPVVLVGLWAVAYALRRRTGAAAIFDDTERRYVLFWAVMFIAAALFSWGYHAPFYKLVYSLPYFSTIRNSMKFMHPGHMVLLILFGYGLLGLSRRYLEGVLANAGSLGERFRNWRAKALLAERRWMTGSILAALLGLFVFGAYSGARGKLTQHLANIGFPNPTDAAIASHSVNEVALFAVVLAVSVALVSLIQIGVFSGARRGWAVLLLAALVTLDLARANLPWIQHDNYDQKYASNAVIDILRKEPWQHRASVLPLGLSQHPQAGQQILLAYRIAGRGPWLQWHYQNYNIQSIDMAQEPRPPSVKTNYLTHLAHSVTRLWELTNTRYLIGLGGGFTDSMNQSLDPVRRSFREVLPFKFTQDAKGNIGAEANPNGPWALLEFGAALPRAKLYTDWEVRTNDTTALEILGNPSVDVHKIVIVSDPVTPPPAGNSNAAPGTVEFASYAPKHIELKASATAPSILLLNDQYDRDWSVTVNGQAAPLLRCNYIMRGVQVPAGASTVVFHFQPSLTGMKITLTAFGVGVLLCGLLAISKPRGPEAPTSPAADPKKK